MKTTTRIISPVLIILAGIVGMAGFTQDAIAFILMAIWMLLASDRM